MTFAAVGTIIAADTATFTLTPAGVGHLILLEVAVTTAPEIATGVSSSNVTWAQMGTSLTGTTNALTSVLFAGTVTSTSAATVTVTFSGTPPGIRIAGQEFSSTAGSWALDVQGNLDSAGTNTFPSLTPAGAGELYFGYALDGSTATAGSTPGYVYQLDAHSNGMCYDVNCGTGAQAPVWGDSGQHLGISVLVKETSSSTPVSSADTCSAVNAGPGPGPTAEIKGFPATRRQWISV